uniref:Uncharacterized protein n=1 Tax=Entomoneis paludosa TaxID=265537 RepID=A0A7S2V9I9_9STRA|mmetsp:Transcript_12452/g.25796  ORF Transcript_12452/g.25796 Transcript_12452/m.25796 type:complete len:452 (+) Transcript_12452:152-1507(+)|eukprot:CAMPEP_0172442148 /NCGR_PEP_ID=MMETSP1065-20121228/2618_1 /TAXON_ID=265537 /ORGANISM="Amphiprora paludosa, Strain CCMP125" /LENGTH=451 /DNA_ID=CAMNT_0013191879 /DNA_START=77 /DNA_END=1432 /DNA_ORIENTATION=+
MEGLLGFLRRKWEDVSGEQRRRADRLEALNGGTYYTKAGEVISLGETSPRETVSKADFDAIRRDFEHPYYLTAINAARRFARESSKSPNYRSKRYKPDDRSTRHEYGPDSISRGSSLQTSDQDSDTAKNRKRKLGEIAVAQKGDSTSAEIAHLVPHTFRCANYYRRLVCQMTGVQVIGTTRERKPRLLRKSNVDKTADIMADVLVHGLLEKTKDGGWSRVHNTGVKHNRANMARIFAQKTFFDTWPKLLIIPIKTLDDVKSYKGGSFEAIVLASDPAVYKQCQITGELDLASYQDLRTAFDTLRAFVKACAYDALNGTANHDFKDLPGRERLLVSKGVENSRRRGPRMPHLLAKEEDVKSQLVRVGKALFSMENERAHQECDPYALFLKAVAVESSMQGEKILPGCRPLHDCEICLEKELIECHCDYYDPEDIVPKEIIIVQHKKKTRNQI